MIKEKNGIFEKEYIFIVIMFFGIIVLELIAAIVVQPIIRMIIQ